MYAIPAGRPTKLYEAFDYIATVVNPDVDDLKLMVMLEAAGKAMYDDLADDARSPEVQALLRASGREEWLHAERVSRAVEILTGTHYAVPSGEQNPYMVDWVKPRLTRELAVNLAQAEVGGEALYGGWAERCGNAEIAALFRASGREELDHARRLETIAAALAA